MPILAWLLLWPAGGDTLLTAQAPVASPGPSVSPAVAAPASPTATPQDDQDAKTANNKENGRSPSMVLPEGLPISGRRAKLVKRDLDSRWFLVFEEQLESLPKASGARQDAANRTNPSAGPPARPSAVFSNATPEKPAAAAGRTDQTQYYHPMEVLPGKWLTAMLKVVASQVDMTVDFRVWGEVTTYHENNYLLPTFVATLSLFGKDTQADASNAKRVNPLEAALGRPRSQSNAQGNTSDLPDERQSELPEQLRIMLDKIPRTHPLELPQESMTPGSTALPTSSEAMVAVKGSQDNPPAHRDGEMVIDRVGRIHYDPEAGRWLFHFEADGASLAEPPVILHPCRLLEVMETAVQQTSLSLRFRISGQVSIYQGRNYMLLRKVLMVYDLENFTK